MFSSYLIPLGRDMIMCCADKVQLLQAGSRTARMELFYIRF